MDNGALYSMNQFEGAAFAVLQGLGSFAPAPIEYGIGGGDARRSGGILASHDPDEHVKHGPGVASRKRTDIGQRLGHLQISGLDGRTEQ